MAEKPKSDKPKAPPPPPPSNLGTEIIILALVAVFGIPFAVYIFQALPGTEIPDLFAAFLSSIKIVATIISMIALVIVIYTFIRITELAREETAKLGLALNWNAERTQKNERWVRVEHYMVSLNSSDWKIAILEADNILDDIVERMGYKGATLGERMKNIDASDFPYLEEAWQAHKLRNALAHKGTDLVLTRSEAEQTINIYHRVFKGLGYL